MFGGNFLTSHLTNTGAFEVFDGQELVFSKLNTGAFPIKGELASLFMNRLD